MAKLISALNVVVFIFVMLGLYVSIGWVTTNPTIIIFLKVYFIYIIFFSVILYVSIIFNSPDDNTAINIINATAGLTPGIIPVLQQVAPSAPSGLGSGPGAPVAHSGHVLQPAVSNGSFGHGVLVAPNAFGSRGASSGLPENNLGSGSEYGFGERGPGSGAGGPPADGFEIGSDDISHPPPYRFGSMSDADRAIDNDPRNIRTFNGVHEINRDDDHGSVLRSRSERGSKPGEASRLGESADTVPIRDRRRVQFVDTAASTARRTTRAIDNDPRNIRTFNGVHEINRVDDHGSVLRSRSERESGTSARSDADRADTVPRRGRNRSVQSDNSPSIAANRPLPVTNTTDTAASRALAASTARTAASTARTDATAASHALLSPVTRDDHNDDDDDDNYHL